MTGKRADNNEMHSSIFINLCHQPGGFSTTINDWFQFEYTIRLSKASVPHIDIHRLRCSDFSVDAAEGFGDARGLSIALHTADTCGGKSRSAKEDECCGSFKFASR